jgi:hypothetical protein
MADFVAVLKKTIDGLGNNTPEMRERVYEKARATVAAKLAAISPPPPAALAERQKRMIEEAITEVEASYGGEAADPFAELENVFADIDRRPDKPADVAVKTERPVAPTVLAGSTVDSRPWPGSEADDQSTVALPAAERPAVPFDGDENDNEEPDFEEPERRRNFAPLIAAVIALVVVAGGAYAVWLNKDDFQAMLGFGGSKVTTAPVVDTAAPPAPATAKKTANDGAVTDGTQKFTQRLNSDGTEADDGPAGGIASLGEGTSVASATQPPAPAPASPPAVDPATPAPTDPAMAAADPTAPAADPTAAAPAPTAAAPAPTDPAAPAPATTDTTPIIAPTAPVPTGVAPTATTPAAADPATAASDGTVPVSQKAIYYEERTNVAEGSAETGTILWSLVQESPGNNLPKEPAIRAEAKIPGKDLQLTMTIKRNVDKTIPASHTIELIFITPENFDGGGIESILRFALKDTEESAGSALLGIPVKITDGYFLVALNDTKAEVETNLNLMKREQWIDVPLVYKSGRRALFTMEKGVPGDKVFDEAIKAWQIVAATAG